jgi:hypothetical protein
MVTKIKNTLIALTAVFAFSLVPLGAPALVAAADENIQGSLTCGTQLDEGTNCSPEEGEDNGSGKIISIAKTVINILSLVVGIIAVIMIVYGGLRYITSGGDSSKVGNAKNTIIYAIVGLVIVALAQAIVQFVLDKTINGE